MACHPFFARIDWRALLAREVEAPVVPVVPDSSRVDLASIETVLAMPQQQELLETSGSYQRVSARGSHPVDGERGGSAAGGAPAGRGQYVEFTAVEETQPAV